IVGSTNDDEQRAFTEISEIERQLEQSERQHLVSDRIRPDTVLRLQVQQVPLGAAKREYLDSICKDLDFARRAENRAHVTLPLRRARVWPVPGRARDRRGRRPSCGMAPPVDVDDVEQLP